MAAETSSGRMPSTQCAAVSTTSGAMSEPPQKTSLAGMPPAG
jgi:hypothetical protein